MPMTLKNKTKTEELTDILRSAVESGELKTDDALLAEAKLAKLYGMSVVTVRRAIRELVRDGVLYSVHGKGNFVRERARKTTKNIALVFGARYVDSIAMQIHLHEWSSALSAQLAKDSRSLVLRCSDGSINQIFEPPCDGYILLDSCLPPAVIKKITGQLIPAVSVDCEYAGISSVIPAHFQGAYDAAAFLLAREYSKITVLTRPRAAYDGYQKRRDGVFSAFAGNGIDPSHIKVKEISDNYQIYRFIEQLKKSESRPDAIFCFSDFMALESLQALRAAGLKVPGDIAVLGFDDILIAQHTKPALSTVAISKPDAAQMIIKELSRLITHPKVEPRRIEIPLSVVEREST